MARRFIIGFETGNLNELVSVGNGVIESTNVNPLSGAYSMKVPTGASSATTQFTSGLNLATVFYKTLFMVDSVAAPSATTDYQLGSFWTPAFAARCFEFYLRQNTGGGFVVIITDSSGSIVATSSAITIAANTWYCFEIQGTIGASTGTATVYQNGVNVLTVASQNFGATNVDIAICGNQNGGAQTRNFYFDDCELDDAQLCGQSLVIARQIEAGTPTYDTWSKVGGATIDLVWDDTPFNATTNANSGSTKNAIAQTGLTASFSATQAGHGAGVISGGDTINGIKVGAVAKCSATTSGGSSGNIRRRFNSVDTDTAKTLTASDAYYETAIFTDTLANLNGSEIGWNKAASTQARTQTVEDVWAIASFTPAPPSAVQTSLLVGQQQPGHPASTLAAGKQGPNVAAPPQVRDRIATTQELPWHPSSRLQAGKQGPDVRAPVEDSILVLQEQPAHPGSRLWAGIQQTAASVAVVTPLFTRQEQPAQPAPIVASGVQGPDVASGIGSIFVRQEQPSHPASKFEKGIQGPNVEVPVWNELITRQELPDHPRSRFLAGVQGPNVASGIGSVFVRQELPDHPRSQFRVGVQGPDVEAPVSNELITRQELPSHPGSQLRAGVQGPNVASGIGSIFVRQEAPGHPQSRLLAGKQGPDVEVPVINELITRQELPPHPSSQLRPSIQGPNVASGIGRIATTQEQPSHPSTKLAAGVQGPNVRPPISDAILLRQELPDHPGSRFHPGVPPPNVRPPVFDRLFTRQEIPDHPGSKFVFGVQGPNVRPPTDNAIFVRQEQPWHPASRVISAPPPQSQQFSFVRPLITQQEMPWHPGSFFVPGPVPVFVPPPPSSDLHHQPIQGLMGRMRSH